MTTDLDTQETERIAFNLENRDAEESLIGSILVYPENFAEVSVIIADGKEEFYIHRNKWIWNAIESLRANLQSVDFITVCDTLERQGLLGEVTPAYITSMMSLNMMAFNSASYAVIVHNYYVRRQMVEAANTVARLAYQIETPLIDVQSEAVRAVSEVGILGQSRHMSSFDDVLTDVHNQTIERHQSGTVPGIRTGLPDLDRKLDGGLQKEALYLVSNRPGGGKTSFLTQIAVEAAKAGKHVALFSMEMSAEQIVRRMVSQELLLSGRALKTGNLSQNEWQLFRHIPEMRGLPITIDDTPSLKPEQLHSKCELIANTTGLDLVLVDYLALMSVAGMKFTNRVQEIDYIARSLKIVARTFKAPVVVAQQMNRSIEHRSVDSEPVLADLNEGGEKDPDVVMFIHHVKDSNDAITSSSIKVAKNREGETGSVPVIFRGEFTRFESVARIAER